MKRFTLLLIIAGITVMPRIFAQTIINGSFENWTQQIQYEDPLPYITTNLNVFMANGSGNITKSSDSHGGSYAARLETVSVSTDTVFGGIFIGTPGSSGISGGYPFAAHPDTIQGFLKYSIQPNDTACFIAMFKKSGAMIGSATKTFTGTQPGYAKFKIPVSWAIGLNADSLVVIISSSNLNGGRIPGSVLYIDDISFVNSTVPYPNGNFETWTTVSTENPDNWTTFNWANPPGDTTVTKSTDSYDGSYALKLKTVQLVFGDTMGFITNGAFGNNGPYGGTPVLLNPEKVSGYYKYIPVGLDTALVAVFLYRYDALNDTTLLLETVMQKLAPAATYTYFEVPLTYNGFPYADTINISFASSNMQDQSSFVGLGSTLFLDQLEMTYQPLGLTNNIENTDEFSIFPNPSNGNITVSNVGKEVQISLFDVTGKSIYIGSYSSDGGQVSLDFSSVPKGIYYLRISNRDDGRIVIFK